MTQANSAARVTELEVRAQMKIFGWQGGTFAKAADIHVQPIPLSLCNGEYKPGRDRLRDAEHDGGPQT